MNTGQPIRRSSRLDDARTVGINTVAPPRRCKITLASGTGTGQAGPADLICILRFRLKLAALITVVGGGIFFLRTLFDPTFPSIHPTDLILHGIVEAAAVVALLLLTSPLELCIHKLRTIEFVLFGTLGVFFAVSQYHLFTGELMRNLIADGFKMPWIHLIAAAVSLRWFLLMMIYGTILPNTWRMSAVRIAVAFVTPLVITVIAGIVTDSLEFLLTTALPDMAVYLGIAAAIAVFGSYRIEVLQHEAQEARQVGQYRLRRRLGSGGMGEVFLAEHVLLRRPCAIKIIRPEQAGDPTVLSRFEREVQSTAGLTHWNTVEIYDYGRTDDGTFYYVMEYLPGLSLQELVEKSGPLPPARAVHFLRQACAALREAHARGLIHRDIKPSNVFACERGGVRDVVKLLDFGLVQSTGLTPEDLRLTMKGTILGSPPFMAPEQAAGKMTDERSDIYSLGAVGYFLLTGQPPFVRETAMEMMLAHAYEPATSLRQSRPETPDDLDAVLLRCLEKDPSRRFSSVSELDAALSACGCAEEWTEERAAAWWQEHRATLEAEPDTVESTPAPQAATV